MTLQEAPQRLPLKDKYLGFDVPEEYRPVEERIIKLQALGWAHLIYFFLYAADPTCDINISVHNSLGSFTPKLDRDDLREIWNLAKTQLGKLPNGENVLSYIAANRPDLA